MEVLTFDMLLKNKIVYIIKCLIEGHCISFYSKFPQLLFSIPIQEYLSKAKSCILHLLSSLLFI